MVGQMRAVLDRYRAAGGRYAEQVLPGCGLRLHIRDEGILPMELVAPNAMIQHPAQ
jgi:hypothetical protein